jgi:hypothetical protein
MMHSSSALTRFGMSAGFASVSIIEKEKRRAAAIAEVSVCKLICPAVGTGYDVLFP